MAKALILPLTDSDAGAALAAIRQLADPQSRSDPHLTVRYPIRRIEQDAIESSRHVTVSSVEIVGPGSFVNRGGDQTVVYLECSSDLLESFSYKPDYPDSIFHITLYEGPTSEFSARLLKLLDSAPWHLTVNLSPPTGLEEIPVGRGVPRRKRANRFTREALQLLQRLDPTAAPGTLEGLGDADRLGLIKRVIDHLHKTLNRRPISDQRTPLQQLVPALVVDRQPTLWSGAPVAAPAFDNGSHRLPAEAARGGSLVLTPPELVEQMVSFALAVHGDSEIEFGDPALGSGIFFAVLTRLTQDGPRVASASAVEVNAPRAAAAASRWEHKGLDVLIGDFLTAEPAKKWNFVLANPPYMRSQAIDDAMKSFVAKRVLHDLGLDVPVRANLFVYFMLACHAWMAGGATAAWLVPADFMETRYGQVLRHYLTRKVTLIRLHTFDPQHIRFENVRVSPAVVVFKNIPPEVGTEVAVSRGASIESPESCSSIPLSSLARTSNWRSRPNLISLIGAAELGGSPSGTSGHKVMRLGELFRIRRGIATGANDFFVLDEGKVEELKIEKYMLRPLLPRPRFMPASYIVQARADGTPVVEPRLFLIDSSVDIETLAEEAPALASYLQAAPQSIRERYLVRRRTPFYKQEPRAATDLVASSMGRFDSSTGSGPIHFFLNLSEATVLNNYLCLYPLAPSVNRFDRERARSLFNALQTIDPEEFRTWGREFAGGMYKLEPRALAQVRVAVTREDADSVMFGG